MMRKSPTLVLERTVNASSDLVWRALTDIKLLKKWQPYFTEFSPQVGFETRFQMGPDENKQYKHICEVTEVIEGKRLTYSWRYENHPGDSYVTFELSPVDEGTKVTLLHHITEPFPSDNPDFASNNFTEGWTAILTKLIYFMEEK